MRSMRTQHSCRWVGVGARASIAQGACHTAFPTSACSCMRAVLHATLVHPWPVFSFKRTRWWPRLQGFPLPASLRASNDIKEVAGHGEILLMVIPTPFVERTVRRQAGRLAGRQAGRQISHCSFQAPAYALPPVAHLLPAHPPLHSPC